MSSSIIMRVLPERMKAELRAEQQVRGQREGVDFYIGEIIGTASESIQQPSAPAMSPRAFVRREPPPSTEVTTAERHPYWPVL